ncbi:MAG: hypothetical protein JWO13_252 [Acidobacteriales bacterium]|nr:hypothetical protein [Terriglobales bacterium]
MKHHLQLAFFILLASSFLCVAQEQNATAPQLSTLSGHVLRAATGEALREAEVVLQSTTNEAQKYKARSDARGSFSIANIAPGTYKVKAKHYGYAPQNYESALVIKPAQNVSDITLRLVADAVVTGTVVDEFGEPIPGIEVHALRAADKRVASTQSTQTARVSITNDLGQYRLFGLTPGEYYLSAVDTGSRELTAYSGESEATDLPEPSYPPIFYPGTTQKQEASAVQLKPGEETRIDFKLQRMKSVSVSGIVVLPGRRPAANMQVMLENGSVQTAFQNVVTTDQSGRFVIRGIFPGLYAIAATDHENVLGSRETIQVTEEDTKGIELLLSPAQRIMGKVVVNGKSPDFAAHPAIVWLRAIDGVENGFSAGEIHSDGSFLLMPEIGENTYKVEVSDLPEGFYLKEARYGTQDALESGIAISNRAPAEKLVVTLSDGAAQINGHISQQGSPLTGATLEAVSESQNQLSATVATTDEQGAFQFSDLAPGEYQIIKPNENVWPERQQRVLTIIVLSQGDRKELQLSLAPNQ